MAQGLTLDQLQKMGAKSSPSTPPTGQTLEQILASQQPAPKKDLLTKASDLVSSVFPGKQLGTAIGNSIDSIRQDFKGNTAASNADLAENAKMPLRVAGDVAQIGLTAIAPEIGNGATALGRIGANAALGAGLGATNAVAQGKGLVDTAKSGIIGGALGGGVSAAGEALSSVVDNLPKWFAKSALPKAKDGTIDYALQKAPIGSTKTLLSNSQQSANSFGKQVNSILEHPEYASETGNVADVVDKVAGAFPNSGMNNDKIIKIVKNVARGNANIVDKVAEGTASLAEQNSLRQELDQAVYPKFTDTPSLTFNKKVGKAFTDLLRNNVQDTAPETKPIFNEYAKELDFKKVIGLVQAKNNLKPTWKDYVSAYAGYQAGGVKGALEAIAAERLLGSNAVRLGAGKISQSLSKVATPIAETVFQGAKAPLIKTATNQR